MKGKRKKIDALLTAIVSVVSLFGVIILVLVFTFILNKGIKLLSWDLIIGDYYPAVYNAKCEEPILDHIFVEPTDLPSEAHFSAKWGIALIDDLDFEGKDYIKIVYVDRDSSLSSITDKNHDDTFLALVSGQSLDKVIFTNNTIVLSRLGAENAIYFFENADGIADIMFSSPGNGIKGSLITTGYLILFTLIIALPLGIFSAVYLHEFAPKNKWYIISIRRLIETLTGVPSIIYGLFGAAVFIPFVSSITKSSGGNIISGALTLAVMVLPIVISATEDALKAIPDDYRQASLALGANRTQTTFKVVLKAAIPGILSAILLAIGRIIGESAALIYAVGTAIKDKIIITEKSTSLAVFIWSVMAGETPNFELAATVAIIIMVFVLILNLSIKLIASKLVFKHK
jgi:phosphate transport system permease protein